MYKPKRKLVLRRGSSKVQITPSAAACSGGPEGRGKVDLQKLRSLVAEKPMLVRKPVEIVRRKYSPSPVKISPVGSPIVTRGPLINSPRARYAGSTLEPIESVAQTARSRNSDVKLRNPFQQIIEKQKGRKSQVVADLPSSLSC